MFIFKAIMPRKIHLCFDFTQSGTPGCLKEAKVKSTRGFGKPLYKGESKIPCLFCKNCFNKRVNLI